MSELARRAILRVVVVVGYPGALFFNWLSGDPNWRAATRAEAQKFWQRGRF